MRQCYDEDGGKEYGSHENAACRLLQLGKVNADCGRIGHGTVELAHYCNLEVEVVGLSHVSNKIKNICQ